MVSIRGQCSKKQRSPTTSGMTMRVGDCRGAMPLAMTIWFTAACGRGGRSACRHSAHAVADLVDKRRGGRSGSSKREDYCSILFQAEFEHKAHSFMFFINNISRKNAQRPTFTRICGHTCTQALFFEEFQAFFRPGRCRHDNGIDPGRE